MRIRKRCSACGHELTTEEKECPEHGTGDLSFLAIVELGYVNSKRRRKKRTFSRLADARTWAVELEAEVRRGEFTEPSRQRLRDYLTGWLQASELRIKPTTLASYATSFDKHIIPAIGGLELRDLTAPDLRQVYVDMVAKKGLSAKTARNAHIAIRKALGDAVKDGLIKSNPADAAFDLKVTKPKIKAWGPSELAAFLAASHNHKYGSLYELIGLTGLRRGEALGMTWAAVDLDTGRIEIEQTLIRDGANGIGFSSTPKSEDSRRIIELDDDLTMLLKTHRLEQLERRMALGEGWIDHDLVFDRGDGQWIDPDVCSQDFSKIVEKASLPTISLHGLRHTIATIMIESGESIKLVQEMLGHADASTTLNAYSHVRTGQQARATAEVRKRLAGE